MKLKSFLATLCCMSVLVAFSSCKSSDKSEKIDLIPVKLSKKGNWSMMDKDGKIVYQDEFKNCPTASYNGYFSVEEGEGYTLYKSGGKKPEPVKGCENLKSVGCMEDDLIPVTFKNERISIVDGKGKKKFTLDPIKNCEVVACASSFSEGLLIVSLEDNTMGYVDKSGKLAIPAKYKMAAGFYEGLALVVTESNKKDGESSDMIISVINKKGEQVFKLPEDFSVVNTQFINGKLFTRNEDTYYMFDKKGEKTKLSSKIRYIADINDDYIIYQNEDGQYGVLDYKGETVIRPKFESLEFAKEDGKFIGKREGNENEVVLINKKGEVQKTLDYKEMSYLKGFGYLAREGSTYSLLNDNFKAKCKEDIYDFSFNLAQSPQVETDYFDMNGVAKSIVGMITSNGVSNYVFGTSASKLFGNEDPSQYQYRSSNADLTDLNKTGFRYSISAVGQFTAQMADYSYDYYSYSSSYYWNPASKLAGIVINLSTESQWGEEGFKAMKSALSAAGYKLVKSGVTDGNKYGALYNKGTVVVFVSALEGGTTCEVLVGSSAEAPELENSLKNMIDPEGKISEYSSPSISMGPDFSTSAPVAVEADSAVASYSDFEPEPDSDIDF